MTYLPTWFGKKKVICPRCRIQDREDFIGKRFKKAGTDKNPESHDYARAYARIPEDIQSVLEIGVSGGESLLAWLEIFPVAQIYGIDKQEEPERIKGLFRVTFIHTDIVEYEPGKAEFDLVVDDGSHHVDDILAGWKKLYLRCKYYAIEDVNLTMLPEILEGIKHVCEETDRLDIQIIQSKKSGDHRIIFVHFIEKD